ncbi:uncharacterized protein METZ01_LOCUS209201, partial [marine metagenome]
VSNPLTKTGGGESEKMAFYNPTIQAPEIS